jgi:hypothetical protein
MILAGQCHQVRVGDYGSQIACVLKGHSYISNRVQNQCRRSDSTEGRSDISPPCGIQVLGRAFP